MIDAWFKEDLEGIYEKHSVAVFIDESGESEFLLDTVANDYEIRQAQSEIEELHVKYLIEQAQPSSIKNLIYTCTPRDELKFIREYCETSGCLEIRYLQNYVKEKVHQTLNLNINLPKEELIAAAKVSIGNNQTYWMDLSHKGGAEIFDLKKELLPFVHDPEKYEVEKYDPELREIFYRKVNDLLGHEYLAKPARTLANEVVKTLLDGLAAGECDPTLELVYQSWLDSLNYRGSFQSYLDRYSLPSEIDIWLLSPSHPFRSVDEAWLREIGKNISDQEALPNYLARITRRSQNEQARALGITFWQDVKILLEFDPKDIAYLNSLPECVTFYAKHSYKLDTAIRNLYTEFLHKPELLEPVQEHYSQLVAIFLDKWFKYFSAYQEEQTGLIQRILDDNSGKTAIIVGDGIAFEVASQVSDRVSNLYQLSKKTIFADFPSETENNMSRLYLDNGSTEKVHKNRENYLLDHNPDKSIEFVNLDEVSDEARSSQYLICTYKDIDDMGEKLQQKALKYFSETIEFFAHKISQLLSGGYSKVYLVSDHGFVLTGVLNEADKISVDLHGVAEKSERYICSMDKQPSFEDRFIEATKHYKDFNYLYFSKTIKPFKTPGVYGYSHGGITPQELITPFFSWELADEQIQSLGVTIQNKGDLKNVTGELFQIKIQAGEGAGDLFTLERKVYLVFFSDKVQVNKSDIFTIQRGQLLAKEYTFDGNTEIEVLLLDAQTKEQLDSAIVKQNKARDLGGLL